MAEIVNQDERVLPDDGVPRSPFGHRLMFLLLVCLAFALFAPTVLAPILREYCDLLAEEARLQARVAELESEIKRRQELADALAHDIVLNERLAMLDLHYRKPGEIVVPVQPISPPVEAAPVPAPPDPYKLHIPASWPQWAHDAERWAHDHGLTALFLNATFRTVVLLMSGGLLIAAFVLYAPKSIRSTRSSRKQTSAASLPGP